MEIKKTERLSFREKNAKDKAWYKAKADELDIKLFDSNKSRNGVSDVVRMKVNYDLFNSIINPKDFEYVCKPFGAEVGELPATMNNKDIVSGKIKAMLGMEMKRPFSWNVLAVNPEATSRKEKEQFDRIKKFVNSEIMKPIQIAIEQQKAEETKGKKLTPDEQQKIQQEIEEELKAQTPPEVSKYMQREHQDPAEILAQQLLNYLIQKCDLRRKFNNTFKHGLLSARGIMYVGVLNGEPEVWNVNSMRFSFEKSPDIEFIEDSEAAVCEYRMPPSEVVKYFGDELTPKNIDDIYNKHIPNESMKNVEQWLSDVNTNQSYLDTGGYDNNIRVIHCVWKSLRKIGFLTYLGENGEEQESIVDENYVLNLDQGDIKLDWEWLPEVYETWKISNDIYVNMRPVPGQFKDIDNLYHCKLPYYGAIYDNMNSVETSLMDRLKVYQYFYNIVNYRLELLMASDKGKKVLMNINAIPDSAGVDMKKWQYFMESTPYMWYDPNEEGTSQADANTVAKVIDLSLVSDINKYMEIAEQIRVQAGRSVGITEAVEGQISSSDAVSNTKAAITQSSHILEGYFDIHAHVKRNVIQALLETAKIAYSGSKKKKLSFILDDMSKHMLDLDMELLDNSTYGIFVSSSAKAEETKETIRQLSHAAMQNGAAQLSDVVSMLRQESVLEMEETLKAAEDKKSQSEQQGQEQALKAKQESEEKAREHEKEVWKHEKEMVILKEEEKRKTVVVQSSLTGASFNPDTDVDRDGVNDYIELAKNGLDAEIKRKKSELESSKFEHQRGVDMAKLANEKEKLNIAKQKNKQG